MKINLLWLNNIVQNKMTACDSNKKCGKQTKFEKISYEKQSCNKQLKYNKN